MIDRRALLALPLVATLGGAAAAQTEVKVAVIAPTSGPWARQGDLMVKGANLAIEHINAAGGIKALNGAKMKLLIFDAGDSVEKAKNAAQRMVAQEPDLVGATGAWLSSFTLSVTEVTERAELPVLTLSYSDAITSRGFKYVFQTSLGGGAQAVVGAARDPQARRGGDRQEAGQRRHRDGQHRGLGQLFQADARGRACQARAEARGRRDLHAAALRLHAADPEGALVAAGNPAAAADLDLRRQAVRREDERDGAGQGPRCRRSRTARISARPTC